MSFLCGALVAGPRDLEDLSVSVTLSLAFLGGVPAAPFLFCHFVARRSGMTIPRARDNETTLEIKEVVVGDTGPDAKPRRYIVYFNPQQARRDAAAREAILQHLNDAS